MPTYVSLLKWTEQGARNAKDALNRNQQGRAMIEKVGGRLIGAWWTQGAYDTVVVAELPDDETASALAIALGMQGNVRTETMRAYGSEEMQRIIQKLP
ncbi:MAG: GYD domain-containing protein [Chloroflexi bacterium]|nr:GYD domain-containing protein [Chloroflexota bacterium]MBV9601131.1 GYD domain-containing protein [Chloroflexota bacterium]